MIRLRHIKMAHAMPRWFGFLALEADLAMTFIDCARLHTHHGNFANSVSNARKALAEIQRGLANPTARGLSVNEVSFLERRSQKINLALAALTMDSN
jgi:cob(I)alamin adenosyltransferase